MKRTKLVEYWKSLVEEQGPEKFKGLGTPSDMETASAGGKEVQDAYAWNKKIRAVALLCSKDFRGEGDIGGSGDKEERKRLEHELRGGHYAWFPVRGGDGGAGEKAWLVFNVSREESLRLGQKHGQGGVLWAAEGKCEVWVSDGKRYKVDLVRELERTVGAGSPEEDFRQISRAVGGRAPFFDGSEENLGLYQGMADYLFESLAKRNLDEDEIDRCIDDLVGEKVKGFNQWARKGKLHRADFWW